MKQKLTLLLIALVTSMGAGATDGSITLSKSDVEFQRNDGSGLNINYTAYYTKCFASIKSPLVKVWQGGGNIQTSTWGLFTQTYTLSMLPGYTISSYVITLTPQENQTLSVGHGTADVTSLTQNAQSVITVSSVNQNSTSFTFSGTGGLNKISSLVVNYSYTTAPTMVQTMEDLACADYSTCKTYNIISARSTFYAATDGTTLLTVNNFDTPADANKKFAFIKNASTDKYYLYHVESGKFVNSDKSLTAAPTDAVELHCSFNDSYPQYIQLAGKTANIRISSSVYRVDWDNYTTADEGNLFKVEPQASTADLRRAYKIVNGWTATYHIDGTALTATGNLTYNGALSLPGTLKRAYCTYKFYSDAECNTEITAANDFYDDIYVKYTVSECPFEFSTEGSPVYYLLTGPSHDASATVKYVYSNGSNPVGTDTPSKADAYQWAFIGDPYGFVIKNKAGNYISETATMAASGASFNLYQNKKAIDNSKTHFCAGIFDGDNQTLLNDNNQGTAITCYTSTSGAIKFTEDIQINNMQWSYFTPLLATDYAVMTYNLIWDDSENPIRTATSILGKVGDATEEYVPWTVAYCDFDYDVDEVEASTTVVNITLDWKGPFDISSNYASAVWYCMQIGSKWIEAGTTSNGVTTTIVSNNARTADAALWAFIGNPCDGVSMVNKSVGDGYYLNSNAQGVNCSIKSTEEKFIIVNDNGTLRFKNSSGLYMELFDGVAIDCYYDSPDGGYCNLSVRSYYCQKGLDDFADYVGESTDKYFGVKPSSVTSVNSMIMSMPKMTEAQYTTYFTDLYNSFKSYIIFNWPETGYYRIKNNKSGDYIGYGKPEGLTGGQLEKTAGLVAITSANVASDYSTVVRLTKVSATLNTGLYTISTQGLNVQGTPAAQAVYTASGSTPVQFKFVVDGTPGVVYIKDSNASGSEDATEGCLHEANWVETHTLNGIVPWTHGADASKWVVEDVTSLTINPTPVGDTYYATLCLPFTVNDLSGAQAYTLSLNDSKKALTLSDPITTVPAGTPVLLRGDSEEVTASIEYNEDYQAAPLISTALTGTYTAKSVTGGTDYFLGYKDGQIGFYHWTGSTLGANRAYLEASKLSGSVKGFVLNFDDVDAVTDVPQSVPATSEWYDLSGRRINQPTQGLYIKNGKKVLVK